MGYVDPAGAFPSPEQSSDDAAAPDGRDRMIAALEGRIRALEYVLSNLPEVTAEVLHSATRDIGVRVPAHPLESEVASHSERAKLADRAMAELWKQKR